MLIPKQTINTILNNWINAGYISFENKLTKKNKIILLTEFGKKELEPKITFVMDKEAIILERLGDVTKSLVLSNLNYLKIMKEVIKMKNNMDKCFTFKQILKFTLPSIIMMMFFLFIQLSMVFLFLIMLVQRP